MIFLKILASVVIGGGGYLLFVVLPIEIINWYTAKKYKKWRF